MLQQLRPVTRFDKMLYVCCTKKLQESVGPCRTDYFGNPYTVADSVYETCTKQDCGHIFTQEAQDFGRLKDIIVLDNYDALKEGSVGGWNKDEDTEEDSEIECNDDSLVLMLRNALSRTLESQSFHDLDHKIQYEYPAYPSFINKSTDDYSIPTCISSSYGVSTNDSDGEAAFEIEGEETGTYEDIAAATVCHTVPMEDETSRGHVVSRDDVDCFSKNSASATNLDRSKNVDTCTIGDELVNLTECDIRKASLAPEEGQLVLKTSLCEECIDRANVPCPRVVSTPGAENKVQLISQDRIHLEKADQDNSSSMHIHSTVNAIDDHNVLNEDLTGDKGHIQPDEPQKEHSCHVRTAVPNNTSSENHKILNKDLTGDTCNIHPQKPQKDHPSYAHTAVPEKTCSDNVFQNTSPLPTLLVKSKSFIRAWNSVVEHPIILESTLSDLTDNENNYTPQKLESVGSKSDSFNEANACLTFPRGAWKEDETYYSRMEHLSSSRKLVHQMKPVHIRLYERSKKVYLEAMEKKMEDLKKANGSRPIRKSKMLPNAAQLRLYEHSAKLQVEGKLRRQRSKGVHQLDEGKRLKPKAACAVHLRLYDVSKKNRIEGKVRRMKVAGNDTELTKKPRQVEIRPNAAHLRLYNDAKKTQQRRIKMSTPRSSSRKMNVNPSPAQLRLYEKSKKQQEEGKRRRRSAARQDYSLVTRKAKVSIEPSPTQIRLYNFSKQLQDEGRSRRKLAQERSKIPSLKSGVSTAVQNLRPTRAQIRLYTQSQSMRQDGIQRRLEVLEQITREHPQPPFQIRPSTERESRSKADLKRKNQKKRRRKERHWIKIANE